MNYLLIQSTEQDYKHANPFVAKYYRKHNMASLLMASIHTFKRGVTIHDMWEAIGFIGVEFGVELFSEFQLAFFNPLLLSALSKNVKVWKIDHITGASEHNWTKPCGPDRYLSCHSDCVHWWLKGSSSHFKTSSCCWILSQV